MTTTIFGAIFATFAVVMVVLRIVRMRIDHDLRFGPHLHDRIMLLFDPFEGQSLPPDQLRELERVAQQRFVDVLTGVGLVPKGWSIEVFSDEVLGPTPRVVGPTGEKLSLAEFEVRLREGRLALEAA